MSIEIKVPALPESVADATIAVWHKQAGEHVKQDENLVDLETDKVVLEVPALQDGVLTEVRFAVGDTVVADQVLAIIDPQAAATENAAPSQPTSTATSTTTEEATPAEGASPSVRRFANSHGVSLEEVTPSGDKGRVTKGDVEARLSSQSSTPTPIATFAIGERPQERVPMSRLRAKIAERLVQSQQEAAMLTTFNEVNLQQINQLRKEYRDVFEKKHGVRLGYMSFFVKAVIGALKQFPAVNASIDGTDIVYHGFYDIGIAVSTERGLVVPVLRDGDSMSMPVIEQTVRDFGLRARDGKLTMDEMQGGTFTITNGGVFGSLLSTPIINPPQAAILGMHKIEPRPVVEDGEVVVRPMMYLAMSYDHRLIDGKDSVQFLVAVKQFLEDPQRLLLDI